MNENTFVVSGEKPEGNKKFASFPYLNNLDCDSKLIIDDTSYMHKTACPKNMQKKEKKQYTNKKAAWENMTIKEIMVQRIFSPKPNGIFNFSHPAKYPHFSFKDQKAHETATTKISRGYRTGGHLWESGSNLTFYIFWVDTSPHEIYSQKSD